MIVNTMYTRQSLEYICNSLDDDTNLLKFIDNLRNKNYSNFTIEIVGRFKKNKTTAIFIDNSGYSQITLDFAKCNEIKTNGTFIDVNNVRVTNCFVAHDNDSMDVGAGSFTGINSVFENCRATGIYKSGNCIVFNGSGSKFINCTCDVSNLNGAVTGIGGADHVVHGCNIKVYSWTSSAYGVSITKPFVSDSKFEGQTNSNSTSVSGNGGSGGGYFTNCEFIGTGELKGHGFYILGGQWLTVVNCKYRGYTKNITTGWGMGLTGAVSNATTVILTGINCNQESLAGYSQTKSFELLDGYGTFSGTFFMATNVTETIKSLGAYVRNRG